MITRQIFSETKPDANDLVDMYLVPERSQIQAMLVCNNTSHQADRIRVRIAPADSIPNNTMWIAYEVEIPGNRPLHLQNLHLNTGDIIQVYSRYGLSNFVLTGVLWETPYVPGIPHTIIENQFPLPENVQIVTETPPNNIYFIPRGQTICFPFEVRDRAQVRFTAIQELFEPTQQFALSMWPSQFINGTNLLGRPITLTGNISAQPLAKSQIASICLYDIGILNSLIQEAIYYQWINPNQIYYLNIHNRENRDNYAKVDIEYF
jgi:hypothetical protein